MSSWITDPELFLHIKENDVYLWRCKKTSWVPMIHEDFDDLGKVTDHLDLVGDLFEWEKDDYTALVAYISPRRLLVNGRGLVIAELYIVGQDGYIDQSQLPCYIRSLDVLYMKTYIPNLRERPIPLRTVQYLEEDGKAARVLVAGSSSASSTPQEVIIINLRDDVSKERSAKEALEKEVADLKAANETLEGSITKLTVDLAARSSEVVTLQQVLERVKNESERKIADLEAKNEALDDNVEELTADLAARMNELDASQQELNRVESDNLTLMRQVVDLQDEIDTPVWMNGLTDSDWVGIEDLVDVTDVVGSVTESSWGTFTFDDDDTTNVRASYLYSYQIDEVEGCRVVAIEELSPNEEKARFDPDFWCLFRYGGAVRICSRISVLSDTEETE